MFKDDDERARHDLPFISPARSFRPTFSGFGRGLIVALTALAFFTGFEVSDLRARSAARPAIETVNRALKGDRLPATPAFLPAGGGAAS